MISSSLKMTLKELLAALKRIKREHGQTDEYKELRKKLPKSWPM